LWHFAVEVLGQKSHSVCIAAGYPWALLYIERWLKAARADGGR